MNVHDLVRRRMQTIELLDWLVTPIATRLALVGYDHDDNDEPAGPLAIVSEEGPSRIYGVPDGDYVLVHPDTWPVLLEELAAAEADNLLDDGPG